MQLAPEALSYAPAKPSVTPTGKAYIYDIEHRSGQVDAWMKLPNDISAILVSDEQQCPGNNAAAVDSVTGGIFIGYDMYGQYITETTSAGVQSLYTFARVISGPADALWTNTYGLPYKRLSGGTGGTYVAANETVGDPRGTVTFADPDLDDYQLDYVADQSQVYGDNLATRFAGTAAIADAAFAATINATGAIVVTATLIADGSATMTITLPDGQTATETNEAATLNYQLSDVWMSKYGGTYANLLTELVRGTTTAGTSIVVTLSVI